MKNLETFIQEEYINESAAKNVHNPRKGSTIYILKDGDSKAIPVKIANSTKRKSNWYGKSGGYDILIDLADNEYNITGWTEAHYGGDWDYSDEKYQVQGIAFTDLGKFYIGVSKEAIQSFINNRGAKELEGILKQIEDVQKELDKLNKKKQEAESKVNLQVTESLKA